MLALIIVAALNGTAVIRWERRAVGRTWRVSSVQESEKRRNHMGA